METERQKNESARRAAVAPPARVALNVEQAAQALGVSRAHFYLMLQRGELASLKIGRRRLVSPESLREYVARAEGRTA